MEEIRLHVFLSYASADKPVIEELARILKTRGIEPWFDTWSLIPGTAWQDSLTQALETCQACAVCIGPHGFGQWQTEEINAAIQLQVTTRKGRVIPVLLPGAQRTEINALPLFLRGRDWVEFREKLEDEHAVRRLIAGIRGEEPGPDEAVLHGVCPYRGLKVFDVGDSAVFHGRESLTSRLLAKLQPASADNRFLAVVGPSGSGKSSLARAGLLGSLKNDALPGSQEWPLVVCKPGPQPLESLAVEITRVLRPNDSPTAVIELMKSLGTDPRTLHVTTRLALASAPKDRRMVLLIDQFEEIFSLCGDEAQRRAVIDNLLYAAKEMNGQTVVVLTLRSDFLGRCAADAVLAAAISDRLELVGAMTEEELRKAIEEPARLAGFQLEGGLTDLLAGESLGQTGGLPLLEHALLQLWQRRDGLRLTVAAYREIGGVAGALQRHAEEVYAEFSPSEQEACKRVFLRLVQIDDQRRATKRRLDLDELIPSGDSEPDRKAAQAVVSRLADERLLTTEAAGEEKRPTDEVAHEALLSAWKRLEDWIDADREALWVRHRLDDAVAEWIAKGRDSSYLYTGARLAQAEDWSRSNAGELSPSGREFLAACTAQRDEELTKKKRRRRGIMTLLVAVTVILGIAAGAMYRLKSDSERQREINLSAQLAGQATTALPANPQVSLLLAATAFRLAALAESRGALMSALARVDSHSPGSPSGEILAATPDAAWLVRGSSGKGIQVQGPGLASPLTLQGIEPSSSPSPPLWAFSPEGTWLAEAAGAGRILLWNLAPGNPVPQELSIPGPVTALALSPGATFVAAGRAEDAWVWDRRKGPQPILKQPDKGHSAATAFAFDSAAARLAIGWKSGETAELSLPDLKPGRSSPPPRDAKIESLAFSPDGKWLAMKDENGKVGLWRPGKEIPLESQDRGIDLLTFGRDGRSLASGGRKGTGQLWTLDGDHPAGVPVLWQEHSGAFRALSFTADGKELITACAKGTVRRWPLNPDALIRMACERAGAGRNLTRDEWLRYAPKGERFREGMPCGSRGK